MERKAGREGEKEVEEGLKRAGETEKEEEVAVAVAKGEGCADPGAFGTIAYPAHLAGAGRGALSAISITNPGGCAFTTTRGRGPAARLNFCCPIF